jgi:hypothetical protein
MRVISLSAWIAVVGAAALGAQSTSTTTTTTTHYTCKSGKVVSKASQCKKHKKTLAKKVEHGVGEAGGDASKLGKKAVHGVTEAAGDVKKAVTKKP